MNEGSIKEQTIKGETGRTRKLAKDVRCTKYEEIKRHLEFRVMRKANYEK